jgi:hypothetical protein
MGVPVKIQTENLHNTGLERYHKTNLLSVCCTNIISIRIPILSKL